MRHGSDAEFKRCQQDAVVSRLRLAQAWAGVKCHGMSSPSITPSLFSAASGRALLPAYLALTLTSALWGSNSVVAKRLFELVPPLTLGWLRWSVVLLALAPLVWRERQAMLAAMRRQWPLLLGLALLGGVPQNMLTNTGLSGSTAIHLGLMNSAIPVLILGIGWLFHQRRPRRLESVGVTVSLLGVLVIVFQGDPRALLQLQPNPYDLILLGSMTAWSFYTLWINRRPAQLSLFGFLFVIGVIGQCLSLPLVLHELAGTPAGLLRSFGAREWIGIVYLGLFATLAAMLCFGYGVARAGPVRGGIFTHLVPVFSVLFAVLFSDETLALYHVLGFVLVAGGAIVSCLQPPVESPPIVTTHPSHPKSPASNA